MMEVPCAPCPPGPTSLPLSSSAPDSVTTSATTTITTTTAAGKQRSTNLTEVSPDSGNGEDLDEFDPLKSPVKESATECEPEIEVLEAAVSGLRKQEENYTALCGGGNTGSKTPPSAAHDASGQGQAEEKHCVTDKSKKQESEMTACMTEKPELFRLSPQPEQSSGGRAEWQTGKQPDLLGGGVSPRPIRGTYYSPAFNLRPLHSSLLVSCGQPFQCGPFSTPCGAIGNPRRGVEENGVFSLPEGGDDMLDASLFSKSYLLGDNGRTCIKPFSLVSKGETEHFRKHTSNCCDTSYSLGKPHQVKTVRNPEYPRCLRSRPARRYTNPEVVRKQPTSGGLMTTSCDLMTSPLGQCACVNPGTSHACAPRLSSKSSIGMLNPMFEADFSSKQETHTEVPSSPRKLSLDHGSKAKCSGNADVCRSHPSKPCIFPSHQESSIATQSLSRNKRDSLRRASESSSGSSGHGHLPLSSASSEDGASKSSGSGKKTSLPTKLESLSNTTQPQNRKSVSKPENFVPESVLRSLDAITCSSQGDGSARSKTRPPMVTSPDWIDFLTPPQDAYTQRLFTPDNLHDELFYPAPYGLKSEVYQNLNAREADFVLQKPNRKPRTEPLPPPRVTATAPQRPESPDLQDGIIPPLATEDEEALKEGARESRKASLKERRKSSLEKLLIPKPSEATDPILNVKIDNFDREEYVKYKKTLSETDSMIAERLKFATKGKQSSQDSDSSNKSENRLESSSQEVLKLETQRANKNGEEPTTSKLSPVDKTHENLRESKEKIHDTAPQNAISNSHMDTFLINEIFDVKPRSRKQTLPRQRSLEENQTTNKDNTQKRIRKQSLPTEELFGIRRSQQIRKFSLHQLVNYSAKVSTAAVGATFSPLNETDEAHTITQKVTKKKKVPTATLR